MDIGALIQEFCIPIIVVFCYCVGFGLKKASFISDNYIPIVMIALGAVCGIMINEISFQYLMILFLHLIFPMIFDIRKINISFVFRCRLIFYLNIQLKKICLSF